MSTTRVLASTTLAIAVLTGCSSNDSYNTPPTPPTSTHTTTPVAAPPTSPTAQPSRAATQAGRPTTMLRDPVELDGIDYTDPNLDADAALDDLLSVDGPLADHLRAKGFSEDDILSISVYQSMACDLIASDPTLESEFGPTVVRDDMATNYGLTIDTQTARAIIAAC